MYGSDNLVSMYGSGRSGDANLLKVGITKAIIDNSYLNEYDENELVDSTIEGMLKGLDDPYAAYYDESAFEGIDITLFETDNPPADYIRMPCSIVIEDREEVVPAFIEFLKGMHAGKKFILESVEIRGENYGEAPGNYYIFNIYMK